MKGKARPGMYSFWAKRAGEVRIRVAFSGVNPGDIKKREDSFHVGMPYPRVIPHSDSSGIVDEVGEGVPREWIGRRVWCYGAQSYRPFGTAAEYTVVRSQQVVQILDHVPLEQGACLGIPAYPPIGQFMSRVQLR